MTLSRRIHRLLAVPIFLAVIVAGSLAASEATHASPARSPVVLNFWDMQWGTAGTQKEEQALVAAFNHTHPGIQVKFTLLSWGSYTQKLMSAVQAGTAPDIGGGDSGTPFVMNAQGQALPLNDLYRQWQHNGTFKSMVPWAYRKWELNGKDLAITWQFDARLILYRKDLFRRAHVAVPTTWQGLLHAARKLNDPSAGIIGIGVPGKQGSYDTDQFYMTFVLQAGGGIANAQGNPTFDTPQQLKALTFEKQLVACCAAKATPAWTMADIEKAYDQGKAAMAFGGGWYISDLMTSAKAKGKAGQQARAILRNTGVLPVLIGPGGRKAQHSVAFANAWMIYKQTKHPVQAKTFLKWMMEKQNLRKIYETAPGGVWPVYKSMLNDRVYRSNPLIHKVAEEETHHGVDYWYPNNKASVGIAALGTSISDDIVNPVLSGSMSPKQALTSAQSKLAPLFQQHK